MQSPKDRMYKREIIDDWSPKWDYQGQPTIPDWPYTGYLTPGNKYIKNKDVTTTQH